jgi:hypothetical protein
MCLDKDIPRFFHYSRPMAVQVDHLIVACNVLADAQVGRITDRSAILAKIRSEARTNRAAELFRRAVALNATLGADGVAQLLGIADGDTIPEIVLDVASCVPLHKPRGTERGFDASGEFDKTTFLAALRARSH